MSDDVAPGALKKPEEAYQRAREDLKSKIWQTEIDGLDVIVRYELHLGRTVGS